MIMGLNAEKGSKYARGRNRESKDDKKYFSSEYLSRVSLEMARKYDYLTINRRAVEGTRGGWLN